MGDLHSGNLRSTRRTSFRVGSADLVASGLTAPRTQTLPDKSGTFAMLDDVGSGGLVWNVTGSGATMSAGNGYIVTAAVTMDLPATLAAGDEVIVHAYGDTVTVDPNGHSIVGPFGTVTSSDTLTLYDGDTVHLVATSTSVMRVV